MNLLYSVAFEQNVISVYLFVEFVMSFASAADHQASSAIVSKQTFYVKNLYTITFCSYATQYTWFIKFWSDNHVPWTIWHLFLGYRGISIIRGKIVAISNIGISNFLCEKDFLKRIWRNAQAATNRHRHASTIKTKPKLFILIYIVLLLLLTIL